MRSVTPGGSHGLSPPAPPPFFGDELPTTPATEAGTVLVTGASGYIGGRLLRELLHRGYRVRVLVRSDIRSARLRWPNAEVVRGDARNMASCRAAVAGVHTIYYLIHSLLTGPAHLQRTELATARNLRDAAAEAGVAHIIYLGGLGEDRLGEDRAGARGGATPTLSRHLSSRHEVGRELALGPVPVTQLRAAIVIGSGSASYEILEGVIRSTRLVHAPLWLNTRCQPIAIRDVVKYLIGVLETPACWGQELDIGGAEILSYRKMLSRFAAVVGRRLWFLPFPWMNRALYSYVLSFMTPAPQVVVRALLDSLRHEVVCSDARIRSLVPFAPLGFDEAVRRALQREAEDFVETRWSNAYQPGREQALRLHQLSRPPRYRDEHRLATDRPAAALYRTITGIGGKRGWFNSTLLWVARGSIDRALFGVGLSRGRRSAQELHIDDVVDFWRVEDLQSDQRMLLRAEMKSPGLAWLEFRIDEAATATATDGGDQRTLTLVAHYAPRGIWGHVYWWVMFPFHGYIFSDMLKEIIRRSR